MPVRTEVSTELQSLVKDVGRPVTSEDVDVYRELQRIKDETYRVRTLVREWGKQQSQDRQLRDRYARWLMIGMGLQMFAINVIYLLMGLKVLEYPPWTANTFIMGVFAEVAALVFFVVRYLFTRPDTDIVRLLKESQQEGP